MAEIKNNLLDQCPNCGKYNPAYEYVLEGVTAKYRLKKDHNGDLKEIKVSSTPPKDLSSVQAECTQCFFQIPYKELINS